MIDLRIPCLAMCLASPVHAETYDCLMAPWRTVEVGTPAAGIIDTVEIDRGDRVEAGQVLALLDSEIEEATAAMARRRAESTTSVDLALAQFDFEAGNVDRARKLNERGVLPDQEMAQAEAAFEIARLRVTEAREERKAAEMELGRTEAILKRLVVRSPMNGVVMEVVGAAGEYVSQSDSVATVAMIDPIQVDAFLPLDLIGRIQEGDEVTVRPQAPIGGELTGTLDVIDEVADARSGTIRVRIRLENGAYRTLAGLNCSVEFDLRP